MKKNVMYIFIGIIILIVGIGCIFLGFSLNTPSNDQTTTTNQSDSTLTEKNPDTIENPNNTELQKEKCLNNICINDLVIINQAGIYSISATLNNNGTEDIIDQAITLVFPTTSEEKIRKTYYIIKLEAGKQLPLEIQFTIENEALMETADYTIENATQDEYNQIKSSIVE